MDASTNPKMTLSCLGLMGILNLPHPDAITAATAAIRGGLTSLQLRPKSIDAKTVLEIAARLRPICEEAKVALIMNDRVDWALLSHAHGAHLGPTDLPPEVARRLLPRSILGVSARTQERVSIAVQAGADYVGAGAVRATSTKSEARVLGVDGIRDLVKSCTLPVVAVGGIQVEDLAPLYEAGVSGVAVSSGIFEALDIEFQVHAYRSAWEKAVSKT